MKIILPYQAPVAEEKVIEEKIEVPVLVAVGEEVNKVEIKREALLVEEPKVIEELPQMPVNAVFEQYNVAETIPANANDFMSSMSIPTIEEVKGIMNGIDEKKEDVGEEIIAVAMEEISTTEATILPQNEIDVEEEIVADINANRHIEVEVKSEPIITGFEVNESVACRRNSCCTNK